MGDAPLNNRGIEKLYETAKEEKNAKTEASSRIKTTQEPNDSAMKTLEALKQINNGGVQSQKTNTNRTTLETIISILFFIWAGIFMLMSIRTYTEYSYYITRFSQTFYILILPLTSVVGYVLIGIALLKGCEKKILRVGAILLAVIMFLEAVIVFKLNIESGSITEATALLFIASYLIMAIFWLIIFVATSNDKNTIIKDTRIVLFAFAGCFFIFQMFANRSYLDAKLILEWTMTAALAAALVFVLLKKSGQNGEAYMTNLGRVTIEKESKSTTEGGLEMDNVELLKQYKELLDAGIITQEEFETKKAEVLSNMEARKQVATVNAQKSNATQSNVTQSSAAVNRTAVSAGVNSNESTAGWAVLGFFIPIVGLILYLVWKADYPAKAKSAGKGALIGAIVGVVGYIIYAIMVASSYSSYY